MISLILMLYYINLGAEYLRGSTEKLFFYYDSLRIPGARTGVDISNRFLLLDLNVAKLQYLILKAE